MVILLNLKVSKLLILLKVKRIPRKNKKNKNDIITNLKKFNFKNKISIQKIDLCYPNNKTVQQYL